MSNLDEILKNGTALGGTPQAYQAPPQLVEFAQSIMDGVKCGQITSLACIKIGPMGQMAWPAWGMQANELGWGALHFVDELKAMQRGQGQPQGRIIRAG
jgi:hypothetical protein